MKQPWQELTNLVDSESYAIERVRLDRTNIAIEGSFELPPLARLTAEDQAFVVAFVVSHGSIKEMEALFGISYPTVKNRLNNIGSLLEKVEVQTVTAQDSPLDQLDRGEITVDEAITLMKKESENE